VWISNIPTKKSRVPESSVPDTQRQFMSLRVSGRRCSCLERTTTPCHVCTVPASFLQLLEDSAFQPLFSRISEASVDGMICVIVEHFNRFCYLLIQAGSFRGRGYTFSLPNCRPEVVYYCSLYTFIYVQIVQYFATVCMLLRTFNCDHIALIV